jgi:hypothetical protein
LALTIIEQQTIILIVYLYNIDAKVLRFKLIQKRFEYTHRHHLDYRISDTINGGINKEGDHDLNMITLFIIWF